jgi:hypothetical protein
MKIVELKMQQLIQQTYMACVSQSVLNWSSQFANVLE